MRTRSALSVALLAGAASLLIGCTPAQIQIVDGGISIAGQICAGVVIASGNPGLAPICATGEEVAQALADLAEQAKQAGTKEASLALVSNKALYAQIVANRAKKASSK